MAQGFVAPVNMLVDLMSYLSTGLAIISISNVFPQPKGNSLKATPGDF